MLQQINFSVAVIDSLTLLQIPQKSFLIQLQISELLSSMHRYCIMLRSAHFTGRYHLGSALKIVLYLKFFLQCDSYKKASNCKSSFT